MCIDCGYFVIKRVIVDNMWINQEVIHNFSTKCGKINKNMWKCTEKSDSIGYRELVFNTR